MRKILGMAMVAFFAMSMGNCAFGPSCSTTTGTVTSCTDYSNAQLTSAQLTTQQASCTAGGGTWAASAPCAAGAHACTGMKDATGAIKGTVDLQYTDSSALTSAISYAFIQLECTLVQGTYK